MLGPFLIVIVEPGLTKLEIYIQSTSTHIRRKRGVAIPSLSFQLSFFPPSFLSLVEVPPLSLISLILFVSLSLVHCNRASKKALHKSVTGKAHNIVRKDNHYLVVGFSTSLCYLARSFPLLYLYRSFLSYICLYF